MKASLYLSTALVLSSSLARADPKTRVYSLVDPVPASELRALAYGMTPFTVDAGHLQIELGAANLLRDRSAGAMVTTTTLAAVELKIGLTNATDLELVLPPWVQRSELGAGTTARGIGDASARVKINVRGNDGDGAAIAFVPRVGLPSGGDLGSGEVRAGVTVPVSFVLPYEIATMVGIDGSIPLTERSDHAAAVASNAVFAHHVAGPVTGFCEWIVGIPTQLGQDPTVTTHVGATIALGVDGEIDAGIMVDPLHPQGRYNPYVAVTLRR